MLRSNKTSWVLFSLIILIFVLVQLRGLTHIALGDENVYYYMAKLVSEGNLPYRDFFYAHPPMHILIFSVVIKIFGVNLVILKTLTLFALLTASYFLYKTSLELFKNRLNDDNYVLISCITLILFLFSFEVMFQATFPLGINLSLMFLMASFYFIYTKKYFIGGVFAGFAGLTRFYALPPLLAVFALVFLKKIQDRKAKDFINLLFGFFLTFVLVTILLMLFFGQDFIEPVFKYHFLKPKLPNQRFIVYKNVVVENWIIFVPFLLSIFIDGKKRFQLFYVAFFASLLFLLSLNVPFEFYFSIAFPFMAIIGAYTTAYLIRRIRFIPIKTIASIFLAAIFLWNTTADAMFLNKIGFLDFSHLDKLVAKVSSTDPNLKIFGDDSIVPLLALMANRSIALNYIDSNDKRFTTGLTNFYLFTNQLDEVNLSYIIFRKNKGLHQIIEFKDYVNDRCKLEGEYADIAEGTVLVYKC